MTFTITYRADSYDKNFKNLTVHSDALHAVLNVLIDRGFTILSVSK